MIRIVGPREIRTLDQRIVCVDTTSKSGWSSGLSPFRLGPCPLYGGRQAFLFENAWQFSKVYPDHVGDDGLPTPAYWRWATHGWQDAIPHRYPRGRGSKPAFSYWDGERLGYIEARLQIYFPLYRDVVARSPAMDELERLYREHGQIALFDFDGYDHEALGMSLADVLRFDRHPMGHAFVLKAMLILGRDVSTAAVLDYACTDLRPAPPQASLF